MTQPPGMIGVIAQDTARFSVFASSLCRLEAPAGTQIEWMLGLDIPANMNQLVDTLLLGDGEWLWFMGDDHVIPPNTLPRLLAHDKDIIVPLCLSRVPPYRPVVVEDGATLKLDSHPRGGLIEVEAAGGAGMLVRRSVFETMLRPWFEFGQLDATQISEDMHFCAKARDLGYDIWCDLDAPLGHCTTGIVWPVLEESGWTYGFVMAGGFQVTVPRESPIIRV